MGLVVPHLSGGPELLDAYLQGPDATFSHQEHALKALLVSNNPYASGDLARLGKRSRLDGGVLGVVAVTVDNAAQAAGLLRGRHAGYLRTLVAHEVVVESDATHIPVGIDGEAVLMPTPVRLTIRPLALRVRVPRTRPGVSPPKPPIDRAFVRHQALTLASLAGPHRVRHRTHG